MARDPSLASDVEARLATGITAERAVFEAFAGFRDMLSAQGGYLAERAADLNDVSARTIAALHGRKTDRIPDPGHPFVLVA
ncbi:phosphoenolpyruvate-utilizing N-terminal domain-containing protein, partial [Rhizobium johnstonii]|uniref:phosphoenolpyruvate-utilizing N-terminal domain-containing protein n=1 Tax=Rhizobium johnstonii TaxID=3019933 RepID=UPI003F9E597C